MNTQNEKKKCIEKILHKKLIWIGFEPSPVIVLISFIGPMHLQCP